MILLPLSRSPRGRGVLTVLAFAAMPAWNAVHAQTERRTLSGDDVALFNLAGRVEIVRGSGRDVELEITRRGRDASRLRIETGTIRGRPTLRVLYPERDIVYRGDSDEPRSRWGRWSSQTESTIDEDGTWGGSRRWGSGGGRRVRITRSGGGLEAWADIRVRVPDGQSLAAYLLVGEVQATDVGANLRLDVGAARVSTRRTEGTLDIDGGSGAIEVRDARGRALTIDNGSGGVLMEDVRSPRCTIDTGSGGVTGTGIGCETLRLDVGSGSVRLLGARTDDVEVDAGSGSVELGLLTSPRRTSVETGSGSVTLGLPDRFDARLEIETGSGSIVTDFPVRTTSVERRSFRGTIGEGRGVLRVDTGSGSVRLRRGTD